MVKEDAAPVYTASNGCPVMNPNASQRVGEQGPLLLQDFHLIDLLAHFDRERIPERYPSPNPSNSRTIFSNIYPVSCTQRVLVLTAPLRSPYVTLPLPHSPY